MTSNQTHTITPGSQFRHALEARGGTRQRESPGWDRHDVSSDDEGDGSEASFNGLRGGKSSKPRVAPDLQLILERVRTGENQIIAPCIAHDMRSCSR
jgi:hypothetical protein